MIRIVRNVGIEERLDDDLEREPRHVFRDVAVFAVLPIRDRALRVVDPDVAVRADSLAVKRRLGQASLASPEVAFASDKPVADESMKER